MGEQVTFARYGLLMAGQSLEGAVGGVGETRRGYFWGTLFEGRQRRPLPSGACHYPVAVLTPPRHRIRCEICTRVVASAADFWRKLQATEMCWPQVAAEDSMMHLVHAKVFPEAGDALTCPVFVLNPLFYLFWRGCYGMELRELTPDADGFVGWHQVPAWSPD